MAPSGLRCFNLCLHHATARGAHPLDEVMLEAYNAKAPNSMDVGVMRVLKNDYKVGLFLDLPALFDSVYVPEDSGLMTAIRTTPGVKRRVARSMPVSWSPSTKMENVCRARQFSELEKVGAPDSSVTSWRWIIRSARFELGDRSQRSVVKGRLGLMDGPVRRKSTLASIDRMLSL